MSNSSKLEPNAGMMFESSKAYTHSQGLSCCFRQWRAKHSHCQYLHGYAIQVECIFEAVELDGCNWVQDFGDLKWLKEYLQETFDHKTLVAIDDPELETFKNMASGPMIIQLVIVPHVGCEAFAKMIFDKIWDELNGRVLIKSVTVREHESNSATYRRV